MKLTWNDEPVMATGEMRVPRHGELFLEPPSGNRPLRVLESHPAFHPKGARIIVVARPPRANPAARADAEER
jgi:hypothetical protein